jgi:hypothetical protein
MSADRSIVGIAQRQGGGRPTWLCFAPDGRVLDQNGQVIQNQACTAKNYRLWVADSGENVQGNDTLTGCPSNETDRRTQKNERDLINMWVVDVPFNGAIRAHQ